MSYLAIVALTDDNRIAKYQEYRTFDQAAEQVRSVRPQFPDAFVAQRPAQGGIRDYTCDAAAKTCRYDPPAPEPTPDPPVDIRDMEARVKALQSTFKNMVDAGDISSDRVANGVIAS